MDGRSGKAVVTMLLGVLALGTGSAGAQAAGPECVDQTLAVEPGGARTVSLSCEPSSGRISQAPSFSIVDGPAHGTLGRVLGDAVAYRPASGFTGEDRFTYRATDDTGTSGVTVVRLLVEATDHPPTCRPTALRTFLNFPIALASPCTDPDHGDALELEVVEAATAGTVEISGSSLQYRTGQAEPGQPAPADRFTVRAVSRGQRSAPVELVYAPRNVEPPVCPPPPAAVIRQDRELRLSRLWCSTSGGFGPPLDILEEPEHGVLSFEAFSNQPIYSPDAGYRGPDRFTYRATNDAGSSEPATQAITVTEGDNAAVCDPPFGPLVVRNGRSVLGSMSCFDPEDDPFTFTFAGGPTRGGVTNGGAPFPGAFTFTADLGFGGVDAFDVRPSSGGLTGAALRQDVAIIGPGENTPPICGGGVQRVLPGTVGFVMFACYDPDGDPFTVRFADRPAHGTISDPEPGFFGGLTSRYTPEEGYAGDDRLTYTASDGQGATTEPIEMILRVQPDPVPSAQPPACGPDQSIRLRPGARRSLWAPCLPGTTVEVVTAPTRGTIDAERYYTAGPEAGTDTVTYRATNAHGSDEITFTLDLDPAANAVPSCYPYQVVTRAAPVAIGASCYDPDGDDVTPEITRAPAHGTLSAYDADRREFTYTPDSGYAGTDSYAYHATDGRGTSAEVTQRVVVRSPTGNVRPSCSSTGFTVRPDESFVLQATCRDADGDPLTVTVDTPPAHGSATPEPDYGPGAFRYTPATGYEGPDSFTVVADDTRATSVPATIAVDVRSATTPPAEPDPPTCTALAANVDVDQPRTLQLRCVTAFGVPDPEATLEIVTEPAHGTLSTIGDDGTITYRPAAGYLGADRFVYRARRGTRVSEGAPVDLTVRVPQPADPPAAGGTPRPAPTPAPAPSPTPPAPARQPVTAASLKTVATAKLGAPVKVAPDVVLGAVAAYVPRASASVAGDRVLALACAIGTCQVKVVQELRVGKRRLKLKTHRATLRAGEATAIRPVVPGTASRRLGGAKKATLVLTIAASDVAGRRTATVKRRMSLSRRR